MNRTRLVYVLVAGAAAIPAVMAFVKAETLTGVMWTGLALLWLNLARRKT